MGQEIERKFLLKNDNWRKDAGVAVSYRQGYISTAKERTVRVRIRGDQGFLTIKGVSRGICRTEFEYEIPLLDATEMLDQLCDRPLIEKQRYIVNASGVVFEIDVFSGENEGLVLAEVELKSEDQTFPIPDWLGNEVSDDPRYFNSNLSRNPCCNWQP